ncbi:hypothetical protein [Streptomyces sp. NBC_00996]|uniref:hypothetical protein n=1 Tax=Streptomyces sp. NBC_00996 TaxID=2903710 RepID=UPI00386F2C12|nr:hypothetical protein OG390_17535 [Streptomyces sp. NBC_00996]
MTSVIVAGALGVIMVICGVLFLRRLLGEVAELRRQITRFDREMRAQRAHVKFVRQLIEEEDEDEGDDDGGPPVHAAVVNGEGAGLPPGAAAGVQPQAGPEPVLRKGNLALYIGGAVAAIATIITAARDALHAHRSQLIATVTGAAVTAAATVTLITVQPWSDDASHQPPSSAPTAASSPGYTPPPGPGISESPSASPGKSAPAGPQPTQSPGPAGEELIAADRASTGKPGRGHRPAASPGRVTPPGATHSPGPRAKSSGQGSAPPGQTRPPSSPATSRGHHMCVGVSAEPLPTLEACLT